LDFVEIPTDATGEEEHHARLQGLEEVLRKRDRRRAGPVLSHLGRGQSATSLPVAVGPLVGESEAVDLRGGGHAGGLRRRYQSLLQASECPDQSNRGAPNPTC